MDNHQRQCYSQVFTAVVLIMVFVANAGYQFTINNNNNPLAIDICDHHDIEEECDKKENAQADDLIKHESKSIDLSSLNDTGLGLSQAPGYLSNHQETPTPPPEHRL